MVTFNVLMVTCINIILIIIIITLINRQSFTKNENGDPPFAGPEVSFEDVEEEKSEEHWNQQIRQRGSQNTRHIDD